MIQKRNFYKRKNFKPEIKPIIENLQNELYQLENKQVKGANVCANIMQELEGKKRVQNFLEST